MVNPYDPGLGTVGVLGLLPRLSGNLVAYVTQHVPGGIVGTSGPALAALGAVLVLAATAGWVLALRRRVGPVEIFFPLYGGLILLWPEVWSGDRFVLPLYPVLFLYAADAVRTGAGRLSPPLPMLAAAVATLVFLMPAAGALTTAAESSRQCASFVRTNGPFACYGPGVGTFVEAARWTADGLPPGSVVLSRKPRHYFLLSGLASRTFLFAEDPVEHLALADRLGARYVLLDSWDGQARRFVAAAVTRWPTAFCFVRGFSDPSGAAAQLLGIRAPDQRGAPPSGSAGPVQLEACPADYLTAVGSDPAYSPSPMSSTTVPLLERLES